MRNFKFFLFSFLIFCFTNCSSDDNYDSEQPPSTSIEQSKLVGTWYSDKGNPDNININFNSSHRVTFTFLKAGNNGEDIQGTGTWELSGNKLYITWDDADPDLVYWNAEILELSNTTLKWKEFIDIEYYIFSFHK